VRLVGNAAWQAEESERRSRLEPKRAPRAAHPKPAAVVQPAPKAVVVPPNVDRAEPKQPTDNLEPTVSNPLKSDVPFQGRVNLLTHEAEKAPVRLPPRWEAALVRRMAQIGYSSWPRDEHDARLFHGVWTSRKVGRKNKWTFEDLSDVVHGKPYEEFGMSIVRWLVQKGFSEHEVVAEMNGTGGAASSGLDRSNPENRVQKKVEEKTPSEEKMQEEVVFDEKLDSDTKEEDPRKKEGTGEKRSKTPDAHPLDAYRKKKLARERAFNELQLIG
jgi:hypothetical protein